MKELRISAVVKLPDDAFEQGKLLAAAQPIATEFAEKLRLAVSQDVPVDARVVNAVLRGKKDAPAPAAVAPEPEGTTADVLPHPAKHKAA